MCTNVIARRIIFRYAELSRLHLFFRLSHYMHYLSLTGHNILDVVAQKGRILNFDNIWSNIQNIFLTLSQIPDSNIELAFSISQ